MARLGGLIGILSSCSTVVSSQNGCHVCRPAQRSPAGIDRKRKVEDERENTKLYLELNGLSIVSLVYYVLYFSERTILAEKKEEA